jgi:flagellar motor switch protein FliM
LISLGMKPFDGNALLEMNPSLVFPILEMLMGGDGKMTTKISREVTEIEQSILESLLRVILQDLRAAWSSVTTMAFSIEGHETEPALLQLLAPNEAVIAISIEVRIGETAGVMNIGIPSTLVKMLRQKFDQQWSVRKTKATEEEHARILNLLRQAYFHMDARLHGPTIGVETLLDFQEGDVLALDYPVHRSVDFTVNGRLKYAGGIVALGRKRAFQIRQPIAEP